MHGLHGVLERDQEQEPWSVNSIDRAHRVAQVVTVDRVARGCWTSIVKKKRLSKNWRTERVVCKGGTRPERCIRAQCKSPSGFGPKWPRFGLTQ